jgi:hypothetical protein
VDGWKARKNIWIVIFTNLNVIRADRMQIAGFPRFDIDSQIVRRSVGVKPCSLYPSFPAPQSCAPFSHFLLVWIIQRDSRCRLSQSLRETDSNPAEHGLERWAKNSYLNNRVQCFTSIFISDVGLTKPQKTSFIRLSPLPLQQTFPTVSSFFHAPTFYHSLFSSK